MRKRLSLLIGLIALILIGLIGYVTFPTIFGSIVVPLPAEYQGVVKDNAAKYNLDACFIAAFISVESNWRATAGSHAGAKGLMQLIPSTASAVSKKYGIPYNGVNDLFNPATNVALGSALMDYNFKAYSSVRNVAVAYNAGGGRVHLSDAALPKETRAYIVKIPRAYALYKSVYPDFCTGGRPNGSSSVGPAISGTSKSSVEDFEDFTAPGNAASINLNDFWKNWLR